MTSNCDIVKHAYGQWMPSGLTLPLSVVLHVPSLRPQLPLSAPAFRELLRVIIRAHMRQTETHRCHLRHDERFQRCVIMLNYSHMQISCILAVIARDWKHRYSICNYKQTGCADACTVGLCIHTICLQTSLWACVGSVHVWLRSHAGVSFEGAVNPTPLPF